MAMMSPTTSREPLTLYNLSIIFLIGLGSFSFGYTGATFGTLIAQPSFQEYFELETRSNGTQVESSMNAVFQAGAFFGPLMLPWIADKWGRRWALAAPSILMLISGAILTGSTHVAEFIVFRFFAGASAYMLAAAPPLFIAEIVPANYRGALVEIHAILFQSGYLISAWVGFGSFFWKNNINAWRLSLSFQCLGPIVLLGALFFIPESPRWLLMQDRVDEANIVLEKIHPDTEAGREQARAQLHHIQIQADLDRRLGSTWKEILSKPSYRKRFLLGVATTTITQFSGVLIISTYGTVIYSLLSYDAERQLLFQALWLTIGVVNMCFVPFIIDRVPRNRMLGFGMIGCCVMLSIFAAVYANFVPSNNSAALKAGVALIFLYQPFFVICIDGCQYVLLSEIYPTHLRAKGVCVGTAMISLINIVWSQTTEMALENIGWKYFLVFIIPGFFGGVCMWAFWPDTRNMRLEEISALFGDDAEVAIDPNRLEEKRADAPGVHVEEA